MAYRRESLEDSWPVLIGAMALLFLGIAVAKLLAQARRQRLERALRDRGYVFFHAPSIRVQDLATAALGSVNKPVSYRETGSVITWVVVSATSIIAEHRMSEYRRRSHYVLVGVVATGVLESFAPPSLEESKDIWPASKDDKVSVIHAAREHTRREWAGKPSAADVARMADALEQDAAKCKVCGRPWLSRMPASDSCPDCQRLSQ